VLQRLNLLAGSEEFSVSFFVAFWISGWLLPVIRASGVLLWLRLASPSWYAVAVAATVPPQNL